jgi:hypothetical protein
MLLKFRFEEIEGEGEGSLWRSFEREKYKKGLFSIFVCNTIFAF